MFLKRIDELIQAGNFDLKEKQERSVILIEPSLDSDLVSWNIVDEFLSPSVLLFYNDTPDGSNTYFGSWQKFYTQQSDFGDNSPYAGSSSLFGGGSSQMGGVAKAALYLRYSQGFLHWLRTFSPETAEGLEREIPRFEGLFTLDGGSSKTKKLPTKWHTFKMPNDKKGNWVVPCLCTLPDGSRLVLFLNDVSDDDYDEWEEAGVNVSRSRELARLLRVPPAESCDIVSGDFQMASGMGRNVFGLEKYMGASEYGRLLGEAPESSRTRVLEVLNNKLEYMVKTAPFPDTSRLLFLPENDLKYSELQEFVSGENDRKRLFFEQKKAKTQKSVDNEPTEITRPDLLPAAASSTIFLAAVEGAQKKKWIIQQIFPGVSLSYLRQLNAYLLNNNIQYALVGYMKSALTTQDSDTPSVYRFWTMVFTYALQKRLIHAQEVFHGFQRFAKAFSGDELIDKGKARDYFRITQKLLGLQHLIATARTNPEKLSSPEFQHQQEEIQNQNNIKTGIFGPMQTPPPTSESLLGEEVYRLLRPNQQKKIDQFVKQASPCVPGNDFPLFVRGALTGILLNELTWTVNSQGRRFSATQGRHPSRLRGRELLRVFDKGMGLLINLDATARFNCQLLPFVKSVESESLRDVFNSGLIMGMVFYTKTPQETNDNEQ